MTRPEHKASEAAPERLEDAQTIGEAETFVRQAPITAQDHFDNEDLVRFRIASQLPDKDTLFRLWTARAHARRAPIA